MRKLRLFSLGVIGLLFIGFFGCTKFGKNITVKGRVLNPITGKGYCGIEVLLKKSKNLEYYGGYKEIKHTYNDENGYFEMSAGRIGSVWLSTNITEYQKYYTLGWYRDGKFYSTMPKVEKGKVTHLDYHMVPYGKLKATVHNVNCQGPTDTAFTKILYTLDADAYNYWSTPLVGCYSGSDSQPVKLPMGKYIWVTKVKHTGSTTYQYKYDTVFIPKTGVETIIINY